MNELLVLAPTDQIAVAVRDIEAGETITLPDGSRIATRTRVPFGFKVAIRALAAEEKVFKYCVPIGTATPGEVVHLNNLRSDYIATRRERS